MKTLLILLSVFWTFSVQSQNLTTVNITPSNGATINVEAGYLYVITTTATSLTLNFPDMGRQTKKYIAIELFDKNNISIANTGANVQFATTNDGTQQSIFGYGTNRGKIHIQHLQWSWRDNIWH
jgi:hypothetical protein